MARSLSSTHDNVQNRLTQSPGAQLHSIRLETWLLRVTSLENGKYRTMTCMWCSPLVLNNGANVGSMWTSDPEARPAIAKRGGKFKALGDPQFCADTQNIGVVIDPTVADDVSVFSDLARGYNLDVTTSDRAELCAHNAQVARDARHEAAAQVWTLVGSLLTDIVPPSPPQKALPSPAPALLHSLSAPAAIPHVHSLGRTAPVRSISIDPAAAVLSGATPRKTSAESTRTGTGTSGRGTPNPSTPGPLDSPGMRTVNSPLRTPSALSSPSPTSIRSPMLRRESHSARQFPRGFDPAARRPSLTPSRFSGHGGQSVSPSESTRESLRHVGEGALSSDSDEDEESGSGGDAGDEWASGEGEDAEEKSEEEENGLQPLISPLTSPRLYPRAAPPNPSPLSRQANSDDEEEEENSPSPASTESEEHGSDSAPRLTMDNIRPPISRSRSGSKAKRPGKSRSRSSTLASLPAQARLPLQPKALARNDSSSSMQTVIAANTDLPIGDQRARASLGHRKVEIATGDMHLYDGWKNRKSSSHTQHRSGTLSSIDLSENAADNQDANTPEAKTSLDAGPVRELTEVRKREVIREERRMRDMVWATLRDVLEDMANQVRWPICIFVP
jgi:WD repeat-containing protein 24